jgi:FkbM family methyltransferase
MKRLLKKIIKRFNLLYGTEEDKAINLIEKYLKSKKIIVVDIGAHKGGFINQLQKKYILQFAVLIEPIPILAKLLEKKFDKKVFKVFQNVLTNIENDEFEFHINEFQETSSILEIKQNLTELSDIDTRIKEKIIVKSRTLDSITNEMNLNSIDLLKIDVQGVEHLVLLGGMKSLKFTKFVWIELSIKPLYNESSVFHEILELMNEMGFLLVELSPGHRSPEKELLQVDALFSNWNYIVKV